MKKLLLFIFLAPVVLFSQELDATVTINFEQLTAAYKDKLDNFQSQIQDYLNSNKFSSDNWEGDKIKCSFNVFFTAASNETQYTAQLVVVSQRPIEGSQYNSLMLNIFDNSWTFNYERGQSMYFNQSIFDPLTSMLDFYAYIIIGFDMDSYYPLGGSDLFSKALSISLLGSSSRYPKGWMSESTTYNRRVLVDNLLDAKYQQFRQDIFDYSYNGIDLINSPDTREQATMNIIKLINNLYKIKDKIDSRSVLMKVFFDAKAGEIVEYLKDYPDKSIFEKLKKIDPPHTAKYEEILIKSGN